MAEQQLTVSEFAARIKAKYPEYKDIDDLELSRKIVDKYPEYESVVIFDDLKKKDEAIPSPSLDGESVSPEIDYGTEDFKQVTGVTAQVTQKNEPSFFQPAYDAADWINKNIPLWSNWASVSTGMTAGILKYADGLAKEASLFFMPDSEMKDSIKKQIEEKGADEVLDTPWEDFTKGLSDYSGEIKRKDF